MEKLHVGDIVVFKADEEELKGQEFVISYVQTFPDEREDEITLEECPAYRFDAHLFEIVRRNPFSEGDKIPITAVFWNMEQRKFVIDHTTGTYKANGYIEFDRRTMDCFGVPLTKLGKFYDSETHGNDFDVVFTTVEGDGVKKAKQVWLNVLNERIEEMEKDLSDMVASRVALEADLV